MTFVVKKRKISKNLRLSYFSATSHNKKYEPSKKAGQQASFSTILHYSIHLTYLAYQDHLVEFADTS